MKPRSVLIVDDSPAMRRSFRRLFESSGWEVVGEAEDGKQGVEMAEELKPTLVTLDIAMPVMNGIEAAKQLMEEAPQIHVIVCTAFGSDDGVQRALRATGIRQVVAKSNAAQVLVPAAEKLDLLMRFLERSL